MEGRLVLKNCAVFRADGRVRTGMALLVEEGRIRRVAPNEELPVLPGDWEVACRGRLVAPGLVDCHTHLVGGQLLPPSGNFLLSSPSTRMERRRYVASLLTPGEVEALSRFAIARALRDGITLAVEHLEAPSDVAGALEAQASAAAHLGLRLVSGHLTHNLQGEAAAAAWLEANADFARRRREHPLVRGAVGFLSSHTCDDALLCRIRDMAEASGAPLLFHLSEGQEDLTMTYTRHGKRVVPRLEELGLLGTRSIAAHARTIDTAESERLVATHTFVAISPRSYLTSERTGESLETVLLRQHLVGLGTSGHGTLWDEALATFVTLLRISRAGRLPDPDSALAQCLVSGPAELCTRLFNVPSGGVEEGFLADLVVYDYVPTADPETGYSPDLVGQLARSRVAWNIVNGRVTVREGQLLGTDFVELSREATAALASVWTRARLSG
ncbi:amidohydrolase family protein [Stigmatella aurantiaca]|uniref:Amidohydrolase domain protein n=1 Tax=Stigmatella aurantiaca (strain DW4/3-1) TaxID=378806 RepID=Q092Y5_STIAD|nr:amidohydrolase family protein [Stigmatella aurantiaca]ADO73647.1 Amidohydrolase domain protein [Stigmatella aurantiaca DW4/3-1]EAU66795.1 putative N-ethylammeline chlorohydrolase [Stigmatella aurantiaca DW4/3-1]